MSINVKLYEKAYRRIWAPVIIGFAHWVMTSAKRDGYESVCFLARDMYPVYMAATQMRKLDQSLPIPRYIYVSRMALRMGEYALPDTDVAEYLCLDGIDVTFRSICSRGGIKATEIGELSSQYGYSGRDNNPLGRAELKELRNRLKKEDHEGNDPKSLIGRVRDRSQENLKLVQEYLHQEGLLPSARVAVADSGWVGTIQRSIERLSGARLQGYYFGLYEIPQGSDPSRYRAYLFEPGSGLRKKASFSNSLFECVVSSPEGMTVGYRRSEDGYIEPIENRHKNPNAILMIKNSSIIAEMTAKVIKSNWLEEESVEDISRPLLRLMSEPNEDEAEVFGGMNFCDDIADNHLINVARIWDEKETRDQFLFKKLMMKMTGMPVTDSSWSEGSAVRSGARYILGDIRAYKYIVFLRKQLKYKRMMNSAKSL